jgi:hypothetical protein
MCRRIVDLSSFSRVVRYPRHFDHDRNRRVLPRNRAFVRQTLMGFERELRLCGMKRRYHGCGVKLRPETAPSKKRRPTHHLRSHEV